MQYTIAFTVIRRSEDLNQVSTLTLCGRNIGYLIERMLVHVPGVLVAWVCMHTARVAAGHWGALSVTALFSLMCVCIVGPAYN